MKLDGERRRKERNEMCTAVTYGHDCLFRRKFYVASNFLVTKCELKQSRIREKIKVLEKIPSAICARKTGMEKKNQDVPMFKWNSCLFL
mmetsp:Transcript_5687/g.8823  ORF Transcript_5687/g.8823 Transcript_5687/m.8823 type:complete len:89 (+) Transcript_5687:1210-1476(+)